MVKFLDYDIITSAHSHCQPGWISPLLAAQGALQPVPTQSQESISGCPQPGCSSPTDAAARPIPARWPHGGHLSRREPAALSTDAGRVYWAAHPAERGKKDLKYFLALAFETYWLFQCNSVPLVAYSAAQSSSPLWCFAHSIINFTTEKKNSSSLWEPRTNEVGMWTEAVPRFLQQRFFYVEWPKGIL